MSSPEPTRNVTPPGQPPLDVAEPQGTDQPTNPSLAGLVGSDFVLPPFQMSEGRTMLDPDPHEYVNLLAKNDLYYRFHAWHIFLLFVPSLIVAIANGIMRNTAGNEAREYLKNKLLVRPQDHNPQERAIIAGINYLGVKDRCLFCRLVECGIIEPNKAAFWLSRIARPDTRKWALSFGQLSTRWDKSWPAGTEEFLKQAQPSSEVLKGLFDIVKQELFPSLEEPEPAVLVEAEPPPLPPQERQLRRYLDPHSVPAERYEALRSLLPGGQTPLPEESLRELYCQAILDLYHSDQGVRNKTIRPALVICLSQLVRLNNQSAAAVAKEILETHVDTALAVELFRGELPTEAKDVLRTVNRENMARNAASIGDGAALFRIITWYLDRLSTGADRG